MGETKLTFERYEKKYLLSRGQYEALRRALEGRIVPDRYFKSTVCSLYYDTDDFALIRRSIEAPVYKEKLRVRSYNVPDGGEAPPPERSQMTRELDWFLRSNRVAPKVLIACDRTAWVAKDNGELRITFDENLRWRTDALDLTRGSAGEPLLPPGEVLMEIKMPGASPMWLARLLSDQAIFPRGFSKYGTCYQNEILNDYFNGVIKSV